MNIDQRDWSRLQSPKAELIRTPFTKTAENSKGITGEETGILLQELLLQLIGASRYKLFALVHSRENCRTK